ncbi:hypothetical protein AA0116_g1509 [Alternaria tenuissima]|nr:hypothetical protein AA0116_g1509 [Alternaria tenuissima]
MIYEQYQTTIQRMKERMTKIAKQFGIAIDGHTVATLNGELTAHLNEACSRLNDLQLGEGTIQARLQQFSLHGQLTDAVDSSPGANDISISSNASSLNAHLRSYIAAVGVKLKASAEKHEATESKHDELVSRLTEQLAGSTTLLSFPSGSDVESALTAYIAAATAELKASRKTVHLTSQCLTTSAANRGFQFSKPDQQSTDELAKEYVT